MPSMDIERLKDFVSKNLPPSSTLRNMILTEKAVLGVDEFLIRLDVWLRILRIEYMRETRL